MELPGKWIDIITSDIKQYKRNLSVKNINRAVVTTFILGVMIPRDINSFFRLISSSSDMLFTSSNFTSLASIITFNVFLLFTYLIQVKTMPLAYNTNFMSSVFDSLSFSISRTVFFVIINWFVLIWFFTGLLLSPANIDMIIILKILFVTFNIPLLFSIFHEKKYLMLPILTLQFIAYSYLMNFTFISILNLYLQIFMLYKIYSNDFKLKTYRYFFNVFKTRYLNDFICGPQSLRIGIMLRGNLLASFCLFCTVIFLFLVFYNGFISKNDVEPNKIIYLYELSLIYLLTSIYARLNLYRIDGISFITSISSRSTEATHDFIFTLLVFEIILMISLVFFPTELDVLNTSLFILLPIPILIAFCFLSTINTKYRKIYLFSTFLFTAWILLWNF